MLIELPNQPYDPVMATLAASIGESTIVLPVRQGIYEIGHFGNSHWPSPYGQWAHYPEFPAVGSPKNPRPRSSYGVCDNVEQVLALYPELETSERKFIVTITEVRHANQSATGGWRWHKWGPYIGTFKPQHEYLYDEVGIDAVKVFHIYEHIGPIEDEE